MRNIKYYYIIFVFLQNPILVSAAHFMFVAIFQICILFLFQCLFCDLVGFQSLLIFLSKANLQVGLIRWWCFFFNSLCEVVLVIDQWFVNYYGGFAEKILFQLLVDGFVYKQFIILLFPMIGMMMRFRMSMSWAMATFFVVVLLAVSFLRMLVMFMFMFVQGRASRIMIRAWTWFRPRFFWLLPLNV